MRTVLPTPAPPNRPILPPLTYGVSRSMTLTPVSNISVLDSSWSNAGALRWIGQRSVTSDSARATFEDVAEGVEDLALGDVADRDGDAVAGVGHRGLADQTVGGLHRDRADQAVAQVLGDLKGQRLELALLGGVGDLDVQRVVDLRHRVDGELHVDDRADDPGDAARGRGRFNSGGHSGQSLPAVASARALAPPTISLISWVISACRAALASRESDLMSSSALSVADFIARRVAACLEAAACSSAL